MNECDFCKRESGCSEIDKIMNATKASTKLFKGGHLARPCLELVSKKKMFEALIQQDKIICQQRNDKNEPTVLLVAAPWCLG